MPTFYLHSSEMENKKHKSVMAIWSLVWLAYIKGNT